MRKFLATILIFLFSLVSFESYSQEGTYDVVTYINWTKSGSGYFTTYPGYVVYNDFDWAVTRSTKQFNGYYIYDIWFFSQSYIKDNDVEYISTNVKNVYVYSNNVLVSRCVNPVGITFFDEVPAETLKFYSKSKFPIIYITWGSMKGL